MKYPAKSRVLLTGLICLIVTAVNIAALKLVPVFMDKNQINVMGGELTDENYEESSDIKNNYIKPDDIYIERFLRPSQEKPIDKKYSYGSSDDPSLETFYKSKDVVRAYFDLLSDASNLGGKKGGCGSVGYEKSPYPSAYRLLSEGMKKNLTYERFVKSFEGIGHINLMKLIDAPAVKIADTVCPDFFVEIETIEGSDTAGLTYFGYYYGHVTAVKDGNNGWKVNSIELKPEDFLCHAYHGWWHDARAIVEFTYIKGSGAIEKVLGVEEDGILRNVLAKGKDGRQYKFVFVRLTNGADVELKQYVLTDSHWVDVKIK